MKLADRIRQAGITMAAKNGGEKVDDKGWRHIAWTVTLRHPSGRTLTQQFQYGIGNDDPEIADVMDQMLSIARLIEESGGDYVKWASEFTTDPAEYMPRSTFREQCDLTVRLLRFLGCRAPGAVQESPGLTEAEWEAWLYDSEYEG